MISAAHAQEIAVRASLDTNKALIGDQIKLRLTVEKPQSNWQVSFPQLLDTITTAIEIIAKSDPDTINDGNGRQTINQELLITVFDTGFFEVPSLNFGVVNKNFRDTLNTLPIVFEIVPVKTDSVIRDIKAIYRMPLTVAETAQYTGALIALALIVLLVLFYLRHRKLNKTTKPVTQYTEPADVTAFRELEKLKLEKPWTDNRIKYYYSRISEILRVYIERRYKIQALEQTTDEILALLKPPVCDLKEYGRLSGILRLSDLVKFAKVVPDISESALQVDYAAEFVKNTPLPANEPATSTENVTVPNN
jgi:hypothetical protein